MTLALGAWLVVALMAMLVAKRKGYPFTPFVIGSLLCAPFALEAALRAQHYGGDDVEEQEQEQEQEQEDLELPPVAEQPQAAPPVVELGNGFEQQKAASKRIPSELERPAAAQDPQVAEAWKEAIEEGAGPQTPDLPTAAPATPGVSQAWREAVEEGAAPQPQLSDGDPLGAPAVSAGDPLGVPAPEEQDASREARWQPRGVESGSAQPLRELSLVELATASRDDELGDRKIEHHGGDGASDQPEPAKQKKSLLKKRDKKKPESASVSVDEALQENSVKAKGKNAADDHGVCSLCGKQSYADWYGLCASCGAEFKPAG